MNAAKVDGVNVHRTGFIDSQVADVSLTPDTIDWSP